MDESPGSIGHLTTNTIVLLLQLLQSACVRVSLISTSHVWPVRKLSAPPRQGTAPVISACQQAAVTGNRDTCRIPTQHNTTLAATLHDGYASDQCFIRLNCAYLGLSTPDLRKVPVPYAELVCVSALYSQINSSAACMNQTDNRAQLQKERRAPLLSPNCCACRSVIYRQAHLMQLTLSKMVRGGSCTCVLCLNSRRDP